MSILSLFPHDVAAVTPSRLETVLKIGVKMRQEIDATPLDRSDPDLVLLAIQIHSWINSPQVATQFQLPKRSITIRYKVTQRAKFGRLSISLTQTRTGYFLKVFSSDVGGELSHESPADFTVNEIKEQLVNSVNRSREFHARNCGMPVPDWV